MESKKFHQKMNYIFHKLRNVLDISVLFNYFSLEQIRELNCYINENYKDDISVCVFNYEVIDKKIILKTDLGSFFISYEENDERYKSINLQIFVNKSYNIITFFGMLLSNDLCYELPKYDEEIEVKNNYKKLVSNPILFDYINSYFYYRMLKEEKYISRLFEFHRNRYYFNYDSCPISLEYLKKSLFYNLSTMDRNYGEYWKKIYDENDFVEYHSNLLFSVIVSTCDKSGLDNKYFKLDKFHSFILNEFPKYVFQRGNYKDCFQFLKDTKLLQQLSESDLLYLYKKNPVCCFYGDQELFIDIAKKIPNNSPSIKLLRNSSEMVHVYYRDFDLYNKRPFEAVKLKQFRDQTDFFCLFIFANKTIYKLYKLYYKSYRKKIENCLVKDNLEDFIFCMLQPNNLMKVFQNNNFNNDDIMNLCSFKDYYGGNVKLNIDLVLNELRKKNLKFYNYIVLNKGDFSKFQECLNVFGVTCDNVCSFVFDNQFLYVKEKSGLLKLIYQEYGIGFRLSDILSVVKDAKQKGSSTAKLLNEKDFPKWVFDVLFQDFFDVRSKYSLGGVEDFSMEELNKLLSAVKIGEKILEMDTCSIGDYHKDFGKRMDFDQMCSYLQNTSLYDDVMKKVLLERKCLKRERID